MINKRDMKILEFINKFKVAKTSTILELFFRNVSNVVGYRRLRKLVDYNELKRERFYINDEYIYYIPKNKPKQLKHRLLLTDFIKHMHINKYKIIKLDNELTTFKNLRPDAFIAFEKQNGKKYIAFIEVEISNNKFNLQKYIDFHKSMDWIKCFPVFPLLIAISNKKIKNNSELKLIQLSEDYSNFQVVMSRV